MAIIVARLADLWRFQLCRLVGVGCGPRVVLVRHADVVYPDGVDNDPSLTQSGQARADQLAHVVSELSLNHIVVSDAKRSQETAGPVAAASGLVPEVIFRHDIDAIVAAVIAHASTVLVIGHSETVPALVGRFTSGSAVSATGFDDLFIVDHMRLAHLNYGA